MGASPRTRGRAQQKQEFDITTQTPSGEPSGSFEAFGLSSGVMSAIAEAGFQEPRPIQVGAIPQALAGRDVLGLAQTGTGKTAAFALPIIERFCARRAKHSRALILAPTRELAIQIHAEISSLAQFTKVRVTAVFGGVPASPQVRALRSHPDIIVACPGRLLDLAQRNHANLAGIEVLVLDEADHMLDMGFLPDIKRILKRLPAKRQNLLFSATMPSEIRSFANGVLSDPHVVELAVAAPLHTIEHSLYPVWQKRKTGLLRHLLEGEDFRSAIVFLRTKHRARRLATELDKAGHRAVALQGNMSQGQRQRAMQGFRDGRYDVLVATDIAARGIDVENVSHVINFDVPNTPDAYTHRIGRTGRAERSGKAYTFVTHEDFPAIKDIEAQLGMHIPRVKLTDFGGTEDDPSPASRSNGSRGQGGQRGGGNKGRPGGGRHTPRKAASGKSSKGSRKRQRMTGKRDASGSSGGAVKKPSAPAKRSIWNVGRRSTGR
jgi:ATP-dependent RNA helicase RhlE